MRVLLWLVTALLLAACATPGSRNQTADAIQREMSQAAQDSAAGQARCGE